MDERQVVTAEQLLELLVARLAEGAAAPAGLAGTGEVGAVGDDLLFWRAREAVRHAELRLGAQAQALQALEGRATAMLGWNVTGSIVLGAGIVNHSHADAAALSALYFVLAACLCVAALATRNFRGMAGYEPRLLLEDVSPSEYGALVGLAKGYQSAVAGNAAALHFSEMLLNSALYLMLLAPMLGILALALLAG